MCVFVCGGEGNTDSLTSSEDAELLPPFLHKFFIIFFFVSFLICINAMCVCASVSVVSLIILEDAEICFAEIILPILWQISTSASILRQLCPY